MDDDDEEDDTIHMGNAIMTFYAALIDLLGRCAPEMHVRMKLSIKISHSEVPLQCSCNGFKIL